MGKWIVLIVLILLVLGPERLPEYAENLRDLVKRARRYASGAKEDLRETLGPEIGDLDWRKLDPRQYDPRTIVRDALLEADQEDSAEKRKREREERVFQSVAPTCRAAWPRSSSASTSCGVVTTSSCRPLSTTRPRSSTMRGVLPFLGVASGGASRSWSVSL